jgi:hypothetical protein
MANQEKQSVTQQGAAGTHAWGQILANSLWAVTLLLVLAFFWQSIEALLTK